MFRRSKGISLDVTTWFILTVTINRKLLQSDMNIWVVKLVKSRILLLQILLYPEGTDKCPLATERSRKYAEKNQLPHYEYVLHPRTTGFIHMVQNMRKGLYSIWSKWGCLHTPREL